MSLRPIMLFALVCVATGSGASACGPRPPAGPGTHMPDPSGSGPDGGRDGTCDAVYADAAAYAESPLSSRGVNPGFSLGDRARFVSGRASDPRFTYAAAGREVGGTPLQNHGLVMNFDQNGALRWARRLSHCEQDEAESVAVFPDGALAVTNSYRLGDRGRTDLLKLSPTGDVLWRHTLRDSSCAACLAHSEVEIDRHDQTVVAAVHQQGGPIVLIRVASTGSELRRRELGATALGGHEPFGIADLAVYDGSPEGPPSPIVLGLRNRAVLLDAALGVTRVIDVPGAAMVEVALCKRDRVTVASVGAEWMSGEHIVTEYSKDGTSSTFSLRVAGGGPSDPVYGVLRGDRYNLDCHEQRVPELVMLRAESGTEFNDQAVGLMLGSDGAPIFIYDARLPAGATLAGNAGVGLSGNALLLWQDGKFRAQTSAATGWTQR